MHDHYLTHSSSGEVSAFEAPEPISKTAQRDAEMVELYADGLTLEQIGERFGVTRERVRQIVAKVGGPGAAEARAVRGARREAERQAAMSDARARFGGIVASLADGGATRPRVVERIRALFPEVDAELLDDALRESDIAFDRNVVDNIFPTPALIAGVWFLVGSDLSLKPDPVWAAANLDDEMIDAMRAVVTDAGATDADLAVLLGVIGAAMRHAEQHPETTITGKRYEALRLELVEAFGLVSAKGKMPWPATRQTLMRRYGGWNDALEEVGLGLSDRGRAKGMLLFEPGDYTAAIREFCAEMVVRGEKPTHERYGEWVAQEREEGRKRPSPPSVRNYFGGWMESVRAGSA